jgi:paraquat-inducible protein B
MTVTTHAEVNQMKSISKIWFIPMIAVGIALWMLYYQWSTQGPLITIEFKTAEGMQADKTKIKSRNVDIGKVTNIRLNKESDGVLVTARMRNNIESILVDDSQFWVVSPQVSLTGISGLSTLVSGVYIEVSPGNSNQKQNNFTALDDPPVTPLGTPGLHITLNSDDQFAYKKGDPIIYKGLTVGQFEDIYFNFEERVVYYNAFIKAPYHQLITTNTKFWDVSGLKIDLNTDGLSISTGNIETLLTNGVTFGVPKGIAIGEVITERSYFDIYANYQAADDERYKESIYNIILVSESIRGLQVGAPVEYRGVHIGQVVNTNLMKANGAPDKLIEEDIKIPVLISMHPGRVGLPDNETGKRLMIEQNQYWIKGGLKAVLRSGSLLTGSLFIDLQHFNEQPIGTISQFSGHDVIPTIPGQISQITDKAERFLNRLNNLPIDQVTSNANSLFVELTQTAKALQQVSGSVKNLVDNATDDKLTSQLVRTLKSINTLSQDFSSGSQGHDELRETLRSLTNTMGELKPLLNQLNSRPNSLIFNEGQTDTFEPKKKSGVKP